MCMISDTVDEDTSEDITEFSSPTFDSKEWLNKMFASSQMETKNEWKSLASSMVMKLQLAIQEVNHNLEETTTQILASMPRVVREVEALSYETTMLRNQMTNVKADVEKVEKETSISMQTLVELDTVKERLLSSSQALKEADNWTTLTSDIEEVMDSGDLEAISSKLLALQNCLSILAHVPDLEERRANLEGHKVRLEALASPKLMMAFSQRNLENSKKYSAMLSALGRSRNLQSCYQQCEVQQLLKFYLSTVEGHQMSGAPTWLVAFYNHLSSTISSQVKWCAQVFEETDPVMLMSMLCYATLCSLEPSISAVAAISVKQQDEPLEFLRALKAAGDSFLQDYQAVFPVPEDATVIQAHRKVVESIYLPVKDQIKHYQEYEESVLLSHLISADLMKSDLSESLGNLKNYCQRISVQSDKSVDRCLQISVGTCFPAVIKAHTTYLENINDRLSELSKRVEQQTVSIQDDWTVFNTCLSLMQTSGELLMSVDTLEHSLAAKVAVALSRIMWSYGSNPYIITPDIMLHDQLLTDLNSLIVTVDDDQRLLESCLTMVQEQCQKSVDVALHTIMTPVSTQLSQVPTMSAWNSRSASKSNISVTLSPQEYVTQIGQYLMTLPQHLEPLLSMQSPSLSRALQESSLQSSSGRMVSESDISAADFLIGSVSHSVCRLYTDVILRIPEVAPNMVTQLTTDIDYICNILEDLGTLTCEPLNSLNELLKCPMDQYSEIAPGKPTRLIAAVRQMRHIPAKS